MLKHRDRDVLKIYISLRNEQMDRADLNLAQHVLHQVNAYLHTVRLTCWLVHMHSNTEYWCTEDHFM